MEILGLDQFAGSAVIVKARTTTVPIKQWRDRSEIQSLRLKKKFDEGNIEIPFPISPNTFTLAMLINPANRHMNFVMRHRRPYDA